MQDNCGRNDCSLSILFAIYTSPIAMITRSFQVCHQQYADDTQLFISLNPSDPSSDITNLTSCVHALQSWFCLNGMALNPDKSDAILLGTRQRSRCYASLRSVDVTLDAYLSLDKHISFICKSAYYHIRSLRHIRSAITDNMAKSLVSSLVCSRLDYANSLLFGTTQKISISYSASRTHLPELLPVMLSHETHTY